MPLRVWSRSAPFCACASFKLPINAHCRGVHPQVWGWWTCCRCGYMVCVKTSRGFPGSILHLLFTTGMMTWRMKQCRGGGAGKAQTAVLPAAIYTSLPITIPTTPTWVCCFFFWFFFLLRYNYVSVPQSSSAIGWNWWRRGRGYPWLHTKLPRLSRCCFGFW